MYIHTYSSYVISLVYPPYARQLLDRCFLTSLVFVLPLPSITIAAKVYIFLLVSHRYFAYATIDFTLNDLS